MTKKTLVMWRDIPAQIIISRGRKKSKKILSERFQKAIDRAAMTADRADSSAYLEDWHRIEESLKSEKSIDQLELEAFETAYDNDRLDALIKAGGQERQKGRND